MSKTSTNMGTKTMKQYWKEEWCFSAALADKQTVIVRHLEQEQLFALLCVVNGGMTTLSHCRTSRNDAFIDAATMAGTLCSCGKGHPDGVGCPDKRYFIQDTRQYVGNCISWWANGGGYTTHLDEAKEYTEEEARSIERNRDTDKAWPADQVRAAASLQVDVQRLGRVVDARPVVESFIDKV